MIKKKEPAGKAQGIVRRRGGANKKTHRYCFKLNSEQSELFQSMMEEAGMTSQTDFIRHQLFEKEFKVYPIDTTRQEFYAKLSEFKRPFVGVATNYKQLVKSIFEKFGEEKGRSMLQQLDKSTLEMGRAFREILIRIEQFEQE